MNEIQAGFVVSRSRALQLAPKCGLRHSGDIPMDGNVSAGGGAGSTVSYVFGVRFRVVGTSARDLGPGTHRCGQR